MGCKLAMLLTHRDSTLLLWRACCAESKQLQESQDLFELYVSDYLMLQRCNEELLYLKSLWDMAGAVGGSSCYLGGGGGAEFASDNLRVRVLARSLGEK
jgi:hypothetical protein